MLSGRIWVLDKSSCSCKCPEKRPSDENKELGGVKLLFTSVSLELPRVDGSLNSFEISVELQVRKAGCFASVNFHGTANLGQLEYKTGIRLPYTTSQSGKFDGDHTALI